MAKVASWIAAEELETDLSNLTIPPLAQSPAETVESKELESAPDDREEDQLLSDGEELAEDIDTVDEIQQSVEASQEDGGLSDIAAEIAQTAVESFCSKWNVRLLKVGKENFTDSVTRSQATTIALESIVDAAKNLWDKFIKLIQAIIDKAKDIWFNFSNAGKALKKRTVKLKTAVNKLFEGGDKEPNVKVLKGLFLRHISFGRHCDLDKVLEFVKSTKNARESFNNNLTGAINVIDDSLKYRDPAKFSNKIYNAIDFLIYGYANIVGPIHVPSMIPHDAKVTNYAYPGSVVIISYNYTRDGITYQKYDYFDMGSLAAGGFTLKDKSVPTLTKAKMYEVLDALDGLGHEMESSIKGFRAYDSDMRKLKGEVTKAKAEFDKATGDAKKVCKQTLEYARSSILSMQTIKRVHNISMKHCAAGLSTLVEKSIAAYK